MMFGQLKDALILIQRQMAGALILSLYEFVTGLRKRYIMRQRKGMQP
jgi:hypothetical protein